MRRLLAAICCCGLAHAAERPVLSVPYAAGSDTWPAESAWQSAARIPGLLAPLDGPDVAADRTEVRLLWNGEHLFIRFSCVERTSPVTIESGSGSAAEHPLYSADCVEIFLDAVGDGRVFAELQFDALGRTFDALHIYTADPQAGPDFVVDADVIRRNSWFFPEWTLPGMRVEARQLKDGWQVTIALPARPVLKRLARLTFEPGEKLRANFLRINHLTAGDAPTITNWAPVSFGRAHRSPGGMGTLVLAGPKAATP